jgi:hypothetical protein
VRPIPPRLIFGAASYLLEILKQPHDTIPRDEFRARKVNVGTVCVILSELRNRSQLLERLSDGFDVEPDTPAAKDHGAASA